jgi:hypothetical protein
MPARCALALARHRSRRRAEATTEITNIGEQRALEKTGFTREGILRGTTFRQGRWHDQVIYSVLRNEVELEDPAGYPRFHPHTGCRRPNLHFQLGKWADYGR